MRRSIAYGLIGAMALLLVASLAFGGLYTIYDPISKRNLPVSRVTIDQIQAWVSLPEFKRWNDMEDIAEYLAGKGVSLEDLERENENIDDRERLSLSGRERRYKLLDRGTLNTFGSNTKLTLSGIEGEALHDIECDVDDNQIEFRLTNMGNQNWFLINQQLTTGHTVNGRKYLSDSLVEAKAIQLFINNFHVNNMIPKFWMGDKLFYGFGETFADACKADFVRVGKSVKCELDPMPIRSGFLTNHYLLITPDFVERGTFVCN